jgi:hypothetical protein
VSCGTRWSPGRAFRSRGGDGVSADREPIWVPDPAEVTAANVSRFARWLTQHGRAQLAGDYLELWRAVDNPDALPWFATYQTRTPIP